MSVEVKISTYSPDANSRNSLGNGDSAIYTGTSGKVLTVKIVSSLSRHSQAPGDGLGYECIFPDTGERAFASCDQLTIIRPEGFKADGRY